MLALVGGVVGAVVFCCLGIGVNYLLMEVPEDLEPGSTVTLETHPIGAVLYVMSLLALVGGFVVIWLLGRARARALGQVPDAGRPPLSWRTIISPRGLSRLLFVPREVYPVDDPLMARLGLWRSGLGIAIVVGAAVAASRDTGQLAQVPGMLVTQGLNALIVGSVVLVACVLALLALVPAPQRAVARRALLRPVVTLGYTWAVAGAFLLYLRWLTPRLEPWGEDDRIQNIVDFFIAIGLLVHIGWLVAFFGFGLMYIARNAFNSADAHPGLPAVFSIVLSWIFIILSVTDAVVGPVPGLVGGVQLAIPSGIALALSIGGALSVTGLAVIELVRLRRRGYRLVAGPWQ